MNNNQFVLDFTAFLSALLNNNALSRLNNLKTENIIEKCVKTNPAVFSVKDLWMYIGNCDNIYKIDHYDNLMVNKEHFYKIISKPHILDRFYTIFICEILKSYDGFNTFMSLPNYLDVLSSISIIIPDIETYNKVVDIKNKLEEIRKCYVDNLGVDQNLTFHDNTLEINEESIKNVSFLKNKISHLKSILTLTSSDYDIYNSTYVNTRYDSTCNSIHIRNTSVFPFKWNKSSGFKYRYGENNYIKCMR